jgi:hypothetical protein
MFGDVVDAHGEHNAHQKNPSVPYASMPLA